MKWIVVVLALVIFGGYARPPTAKDKPKASSSSADPLLLDLARPTPQPLRMVSSTDPKGGNEDYVTLKPKQTAEFAKISGPITVLRVWCTADPFDQLSMSAVVDGKTIAMVKQGKSAGFPKQRELGELHEKCFYSYAPLTVKKSVKLTATNHSEKDAKFFYQMNYRNSAEPVPMPTNLMSGYRVDSRTVPGIHTSGVNPRIMDAQPVFKLELGRRVFSPLHNKDLTPIYVRLNTTDATVLNQVVLTVNYSLLQKKGVEIPLGALAAQFFDTHSLVSSLLQVRVIEEGKVRATEIAFLLPIHYEPGLTISLENKGRQVVKGWLFLGESKETRGEVPYRLHAREVTLKSQKGKYLELLDVKGEGNLVGLTFACATKPPLRGFAMLEGDEHIEVDDDPKLTLHGTGTEDFFNSSWYFPDKPFSRPFHGLTHKSTPPAKVSCYRWMLTDRIPFKKHLKFLFEHGGRNNTEGVEYRAVVFWYQRP